MRVLPAIVMVSVFGFAVAQDTFSRTFAEGSKTDYQFEMKLEVAGTEAVATSKITAAIVKVAESTLDWEFSWTEPKLEVGGEAQQVPIEKIVVKTDKEGVPQEVSGGIVGADPARTFMTLAHWGPLKSESGSTWTQTIPASEKLGMKAFTLEGKFLGPETLNEKPAFKFELKAKEADTNFSVENVYWLAADGKLLKLEGKFMNLDVPAVGSTANGSVKLSAL